MGFDDRSVIFEEASGNRIGFKEAAGNCVRMSYVTFKKEV